MISTTYRNDTSLVVSEQQDALHNMFSVMANNNPLQHEVSKTQQSFQEFMEEMRSMMKQQAQSIAALKRQVVALEKEKKENEALHRMQVRLLKDENSELQKSIKDIVDVGNKNTRFLMEQIGDLMDEMQELKAKFRSHNHHAGVADGWTRSTNPEHLNFQYNSR